MYLDETRILIEIIKSEICEYELPQNVISKLTKDVLNTIYAIAMKHDLAHFVAIALRKCGVLDENVVSQSIWKNVRVAMYRSETMQYELNQISELFEKERIAYIPLKGAVIRSYYPASWMRTSSDIDILVREGDLERAKSVLIKHLGYKVFKNNYHDIAMTSPGHTLLELHFKITENEKGMDQVLSRVWEYVYPIQEGSYRYVMTSEYLIFHTVAHMLYHFLHGGCGIRFLMDLWILQKHLEYDQNILDDYYDRCGILKFARHAEQLSKVWFEGKRHNELTMQMQQYIVDGGLFGSFESKIVAHRTKMKNRFLYLWTRVFQPYDELKMVYPKLQNNPMLYPFYTVKRMMKIFNRDEAVRIRKELEVHNNMKQETVDALNSLFVQLGV